MYPDHLEYLRSLRQEFRLPISLILRVIIDDFKIRRANGESETILDKLAAGHRDALKARKG
jgi:hypothetical protein